MTEKPRKQSAVGEWQDRLRSALLYGSPFLAAAITVSLCVLEDHRLIWTGPSYRERGTFMWVNLGLAVLGSAAGGLLMPVSAGERIARAVSFGMLSAVVYFVALGIGMLLFVRIGI